MTFPTTELMTAVYNRLSGEDGEGLGIGEDVYTAGSVPTEASGPHVVVEVPRTDGFEYLDGNKQFNVRHSIRVHTRFPPAKADRTKALSIADDVHGSLEGADLQLSGFQSPHLPVPEQRPVPPYDVGSDTAYDISMEYRYLL